MRLRLQSCASGWPVTGSFRAHARKSAPRMTTGTKTGTRKRVLIAPSATIDAGDEIADIDHDNEHQRTIDRQSLGTFEVCVPGPRGHTQRDEHGASTRARTGGRGVACRPTEKPRWPPPNVSRERCGRFGSRAHRVAAGIHVPVHPQDRGARGEHGERSTRAAAPALRLQPPMSRDQCADRDRDHPGISQIKAQPARHHASATKRRASVGRSRSSSHTRMKREQDGNERGVR